MLIEWQSYVLANTSINKNTNNEICTSKFFIKAKQINMHSNIFPNQKLLSMLTLNGFCQVNVSQKRLNVLLHIKMWFFQSGIVYPCSISEWILTANVFKALSVKMTYLNGGSLQESSQLLTSIPASIQHFFIKTSTFAFSIKNNSPFFSNMHESTNLNSFVQKTSQTLIFSYYKSISFSCSGNWSENSSWANFFSSLKTEYLYSL